MPKLAIPLQGAQTDTEVVVLTENISMLHFGYHYGTRARSSVPYSHASHSTR